MNDKKWKVYLVRCSDNSLYCGISNDYKSRLIEHNSGRDCLILSLHLYNTLIKVLLRIQDKWGVDPENVKLIEYNLLANQGAEFNVGAVEIETTKSYIAGSIADMQSLLVDVDENVPKEERAFQQVEDERVKADFNFRKVCE